MTPRELAKIVLEELGSRNQTLAFAESCTGGLAAGLVTEIPGSSRVFLGSAVTYSNEAKTALVGVPKQLLDAHGAVSEEVAIAMAEGARSRLGASIGLSFTGVAGPGGGSEKKPVGLVHFAVATAHGTYPAHHIFEGDRQAIRERAVAFGLGMVRGAPK